MKRDKKIKDALLVFAYVANGEHIFHEKTCLCPSQMRTWSFNRIIQKVREQKLYRARQSEAGKERPHDEKLLSLFKHSSFISEHGYNLDYTGALYPLRKFTPLQWRMIITLKAAEYVPKGLKQYYADLLMLSLLEGGML